MESSKKIDAKDNGVSLSSVTLAMAEGGINTAQDFSNIMSSLMTDLIAGRLTPQVGNAVCNAGGKMLKAVEMQLKYGSPSKDVPGRKVLLLADKQENKTE